MTMARLKELVLSVYSEVQEAVKFKCKEIIGKDSRLIVWDSMDEYSNDAKCKRINGDLAEVIDYIRKNKNRPAYVPKFNGMHHQLNTFCRIVHAIGNLRFMCEALNEVTTANKAPPDWKWLCSRGRH